MQYPTFPITFKISQKEIFILNEYLSRDDLRPDIMHIHVFGNTFNNQLKIAATDAHRMFWIEKEYQCESNNGDHFHVVLPKNIESGEITINAQGLVVNGNKFEYPEFKRITGLNQIIPRLSDLEFIDVEEWYMRLCCDALEGNVNYTQKITFDLGNECITSMNDEEYFKSTASVELLGDFKTLKGKMNYSKISFNLKFLQEIFKYKKSERKFRIFWPKNENKALTIYDIEKNYFYLIMPCR